MQKCEASALSYSNFSVQYIYKNMLENFYSFVEIICMFSKFSLAMKDFEFVFGSHMSFFSKWLATSYEIVQQT